MVTLILELTNVYIVIVTSPPMNAKSVKSLSKQEENWENTKKKTKIIILIGKVTSVDNVIKEQ